jgi:hypothetical protein
MPDPQIQNAHWTTNLRSQCTPVMHLKRSLWQALSICFETQSELTTNAVNTLLLFIYRRDKSKHRTQIYKCHWTTDWKYASFRWYQQLYSANLIHVFKGRNLPHTDNGVIMCGNATHTHAQREDINSHYDENWLMWQNVFVHKISLVTENEKKRFFFKAKCDRRKQGLVWEPGVKL